MMSDTMPLPVTVRDGLGNGNVLMSLPTSLVHCILSDWVNVVALIRLDLAFCGVAEFHLQLLDILKSDLFYINEVGRPDNLPTRGVPPPEHPYTHMLDWIVRRHIKVVHIELHELCSPVVLETLLRKAGEHVRHIRPHRMDGDHLFPTQSALIAKYCRNLTSYVVDSYEAHDGCLLCVLNNNPRLKKLHIHGSLGWEKDPTRKYVATLHHLQQLQWAENDRFGKSLVALVRAAPNLQQLSLRGYVTTSTEINGNLVLEVARACPRLRTLCCNELHFGPKDRFLQPFLAVCRNIVNIDLTMHYELTDDVLIEALGELNSLHCLDLRGCCRLTDRTLQFLAQRFAALLQVLYLDYSVHFAYAWEDVMDGVVRNNVTGGYTTAGVASLRAQCTYLHTFHYALTTGGKGPAPPVDAYESATIVHMATGYEEFLPMILEHCQQMHILTINSANDRRVWLTVDQLMAIAARCPQLHTVIIRKKFWMDEKDVDYSVVKEAYPKLRFTKDETAADFDILTVPV